MRYMDHTCTEIMIVGEETYLLNMNERILA